MRIPVIIVVVLSMACVACAVVALPDEYYENHRYEYHHSFRPPFFVALGNTIPFWHFGEAAVASENYIRLTPHEQSRQGWLWNDEPITAANWEVFLEFKVQGATLGADGLAFWYSADKGSAGPVFGSNDKWDGLLVAFDSFDNNENGDNPRVTAMVNDGSLSWPHGSDGSPLESASCSFNFRNSPATMVARIRYEGGSVEVRLGYSNQDEHQFYPCGEAFPAELPVGGYFGVSAATGGMVDHHDVYSFTMFDLTPSEAEDWDVNAHSGYDAYDAGHDETASEQPVYDDNAADTMDMDGEIPHEHVGEEPEEVLLDDEQLLPDLQPAPPLSARFADVMEELKQFGAHDEEVDPEELDFKVKLPPEPGASEKEHYDYIIQSLKLMHHQHEQVMKAFEAVLVMLDEEREFQANQGHAFSTAFEGLYGNVFLKSDVSLILGTLKEWDKLLRSVKSVKTTLKSLSRVAGLSNDHRGLVERMSRLVQETLTRVSPTVKPNQRGTSLMTTFTAQLSKLAEDRSGMSIYVYIAAGELLLFLLFVVVSSRKTRRRGHVL